LRSFVCSLAGIKQRPTKIGRITTARPGTHTSLRASWVEVDGEPQNAERDDLAEGWTRLSPAAVLRAVREGTALLIDTRSAAQRARVGELPGATVVDRTVLEWRVNPSAATCIPEARDRPKLIMICRQGFSFSFAAQALRDLGLDATDVIDGVENWLAAGLPLSPGPADIRE
jgi:rhodanese-related sulfurtransferase